MIAIFENLNSTLNTIIKFKFNYSETICSNFNVFTSTFSKENHFNNI